jgi:NAD(P)-dependent dehydrogenase (short-subunit alcohol dehydrogenase family)
LNHGKPRLLPWFFSSIELRAQGIDAHGFPVDLSRPADVRATISKIRSTVGPIGIIFYNPYGKSFGAVEGTPDDWEDSFHLNVGSLSESIREALPDLEALKGAVLVTGGGLSLENDALVQLAVDWNAASLAVAKAAQRKYVAVLHKTLKARGVFVGEVTVLGSVIGTAFESPDSTLTVDAIVAKFAEHLAARSEVFTSIK